MKKAFLLATALVVLAGFVTWWMGREPPADAVAPSAAGTPPPPKAAGTSLPAPLIPRAAVPGTSFPPTATIALDVPAKGHENSLLTAAAEGNFRAQCRVAAELENCAPVVVRLPGVVRAETRGPRLVAAPARAYTQDVEVCDRLTQGGRVPAWTYLFAAATGGHVPSMARYAIQPPLDMQEPENDPDGWQVYRSHAPALLRQAADAGERSAVLYLAMEHSRGALPRFRPGGVELATTDDFQAARYAFAYQMLEPGSNMAAGILNIVKDRLTPERLAVARGEAEAMYAAWPVEVRNPRPSQTSGQMLPRGMQECYE